MLKRFYIYLDVVKIMFNIFLQWFEHKFGAYGNCYTFNQQIPEWLAEQEDVKLPIIQDNPGPTGGLNIILDMQTVRP